MARLPWADSPSRTSTTRSPAVEHLELFQDLDESGGVVTAGLEVETQTGPAVWGAGVLLVVRKVSSAWAPMPGSRRRSRWPGVRGRGRRVLGPAARGPW